MIVKREYEKETKTRQRTDKPLFETVEDAPKTSPLSSLFKIMPVG